MDSGFLLERGAAVAAGDGDLSLALGNPQQLTAAGTAEIFVIPVAGLGPLLTEHAGDGIGDGKELVVLAPAPVIVAGEGAEEGIENQNIPQNGENTGRRHVLEERGEEPADQTQDQQTKVQLIVAVTAIHQFAEKVAHEKNSLHAAKSLD